jgi:predicted XRE-type DNA-binding protein
LHPTAVILDKAGIQTVNYAGERHDARTMKITQSSHNVYADIGVAQPEAMLAKAQLAQRVGSIIAARKLTQREAAEIIGVPQPKLSNILRGHFRGVSEAKLMDCLLRLGNDVQIVVKPARRKASIGSLSVAFA